MRRALLPELRAMSFALLAGRLMKLASIDTPSVGAGYGV
jgi:hypothetical protein